MELMEVSEVSEATVVQVGWPLALPLSVSVEAD